MLKLSESYEVGRFKLRFDLTRFSHASSNQIDTANYQFCADLQGEVSKFSPKVSYLELDFDIMHEADIASYAVCCVITMV